MKAVQPPSASARLAPNRASSSSPVPQSMMNSPIAARRSGSEMCASRRASASSWSMSQVSRRTPGEGMGNSVRNSRKRTREEALICLVDPKVPKKLLLRGVIARQDSLRRKFLAQELIPSRFADWRAAPPTGSANALSDC